MFCQGLHAILTFQNKSNKRLRRAHTHTQRATKAPWLTPVCTTPCPKTPGFVLLGMGVVAISQYCSDLSDMAAILHTNSNRAAARFVYFRPFFCILFSTAVLWKFSGFLSLRNFCICEMVAVRLCVFVIVDIVFVFVGFPFGSP